MPGKPSPIGDLTVEYLRRFPTYSSRRLAGIIVSAAPGMFKDEEAARNSIRYYRGQMGDGHRKLVNAAHFVPRVEIHAGDNEPREPLELTAADLPAICIGDLQIPFHDEDIVEMAIARAVEIKAKTIVIMGDFTDCYQLSYFLRDPRKRKFKDEVAIAREILGAIRASLPKARIIWKKGNHEFRLDAYLMRQAPEVFDLDVMSFASVYHLPEYRVEVVDDKRLIKYKQLYLLHGHEYRGGMNSPVNPARTLFLKAKRSAAEWHFHRANAHIDKAINGDITTTWSVGCMCGLSPEFMPLNDWQHGFAELYDADDMWYFRNRKIINYRYVE